MKLRNKKTGKIVKLLGYVKTGDDRMFFRFEDDKGTYKKEYNSLTELNEEWEDYEESKDFWYIDCYGEVLRSLYNGSEWDGRRKLIGNYFETKEEVEKALEKLKAWKRLKDKGFRFVDWTENSKDEIASQVIHCDFGNAGWDDLELLFGDKQ